MQVHIGLVSSESRKTVNVQLEIEILGIRRTLYMSLLFWLSSWLSSHASERLTVQIIVWKIW